MILVKSLSFKVSGKFVLIETLARQFQCTAEGSAMFPAVVMTTTCPQTYGIFWSITRSDYSQFSAKLDSLSY